MRGPHDCDFEGCWAFLPTKLEFNEEFSNGCPRKSDDALPLVCAVLGGGYGRFAELAKRTGAGRSLVKRTNKVEGEVGTGDS